MLTLTDRLTVPQIFLNDKHIGGADEAITLLKSWDDDKSYTSSLERYRDEVESQPDPSDSRLMQPTRPPDVPKPAPERNEEDKVLLPNGNHRLSVLELTQKLLASLPKKNLSYLGKVYKNCFKGKDGVTALMRTFDIQSKDDAIKFGKLLQERQILHHVTKDHEFSDSGYFFRLQPYQTPKILNSYRVWTDRVDSNYMGLLSRLNVIMRRIMSRCTNSNGDVDYIAAGEDSEYPDFEEAVCEIQKVSMKGMDDETKVRYVVFYLKNSHNVFVLFFCSIND